MTFDTGSVVDYVKIRSEEISSLRTSVEVPSVTASPSELAATLVSLRGVLDRVESLYVEILNVQGRVRRAVSSLKEEVDIEWSLALSERKKVKEAYEGPRERYADADLAVLDKRTELKTLEALLDGVSTSVSIAKISLAGLEGHRSDLAARLRVWNVESSLER